MGNDANSGKRSVVVFSPEPSLTVTVEKVQHGGHERDDVHIHAGGQGVWVARMLGVLGIEARLCAPLGGEIGQVLQELMRNDAIVVIGSPLAGSNGAYIDDRRSGKRDRIAQMPPGRLTRHELLYGNVIAEGRVAGTVVLTGSPFGIISTDTYRRLAADLRTLGVIVLADLHGDALDAVLAGGVTVVKVANDELVDDGRAESDDVSDLVAAMRKIVSEGADHVVVSRAGEPAIALVDDKLVQIRSPQFEEVDHHGAGDSMTASIAAQLARGKSWREALSLAAAAGALNVTRHGLATGKAEQIEKLADEIKIEPLRE